MKTFHICTIVNNWDQYQAMRASFATAGFDDICCRFSVFDNRNGNTHEAYGTFNRIMEETEEPYIIYCHQDILLDRGHGYMKLLEIVRQLEKDDPAWAVLGNAGVTEDHKLVLQVYDPFCHNLEKDINPTKVCSLDENFLIIKTTSGLRCSAELHGFHLYATDLCLQAASAQRSCYVISFYLTHLSKGQIDANFRIAQKRFQQQWSQQFRFRYVGTTCAQIFLSRNPVVQFLFSSYRVTHWLFASPLRHKLICRVSDRTYAR